MSHVAVIAKLTAALGSSATNSIAALQAALDNAEAEPGTLKYILHTDAGDADLVWFYEVYADADALDGAQELRGFKALGSTLAPRRRRSSRDHVPQSGGRQGPLIAEPPGCWMNAAR